MFFLMNRYKKHTADKKWLTLIDRHDDWDNDHSIGLSLNTLFFLMICKQQLGNIGNKVHRKEHHTTQTTATTK